MAENIEERLGTAIAEYTPNAIKFRGLSLETLQQILQEGYTTPTASFNATPTVNSFIEFRFNLGKTKRFYPIPAIAPTCIMGRKFKI